MVFGGQKGTADPRMFPIAFVAGMSETASYNGPVAFSPHCRRGSRGHLDAALYSKTGWLRRTLEELASGGSKG